MRPHIVTTSPRVDNFFYTTFNQTTETFGINLEGYCIGGIPRRYLLTFSFSSKLNSFAGVKGTQSEEAASLKVKCTDGVLAALSTISPFFHDLYSFLLF